MKIKEHESKMALEYEKLDETRRKNEMDVEERKRQNRAAEEETSRVNREKANETTRHNKVMESKPKASK